jgi:hypothetical protein
VPSQNLFGFPSRSVYHFSVQMKRLLLACVITIVGAACAPEQPPTQDIAVKQAEMFLARVTPGKAYALIDARRPDSKLLPMWTLAFKSDVGSYGVWVRVPEMRVLHVGSSRLGQQRMMLSKGRPSMFASSEEAREHLLKIMKRLMGDTPFRVIDFAYGPDRPLAKGNWFAGSARMSVSPFINGHVFAGQYRTSLQIDAHDGDLLQYWSHSSVPAVESAPPHPISRAEAAEAAFGSVPKDLKAGLYYLVPKGRDSAKLCWSMTAGKTRVIVDAGNGFVLSRSALK